MNFSKYWPLTWLSWLLSIGPAVADSTGWTTNLAETLRLSGSPAKPVLVDFSASWCGPCRQMARTTLRDEAVLRELERFACVAVDIDVQPKLAETYGVRAVPTFLILHSDGDELLRSSGYLDAERFRAWLGLAAREFSAAQERKRAFQIQQQRLTTELASADMSVRRTAVRQLFDLSARREQSEQAAALGPLKEIAGREPALLLEGLEHPQLAVRIQVSNLLRARLGDPFPYDPWDTPAARHSALAELRRRLEQR